jgi:hypothetical protein
VADKLDIDLSKAKFIHEHLFTITRDGGKEKEFLRYWKLIKLFFENNGLHGSEGVSMGLAAAKAGLAVFWDPHEGLRYFKECMLKEKIKHGYICSSQEKALLHSQTAIEYPNRGPLGKLFFNRYARKYFWKYMNFGYWVRFFKLKYFKLQNKKYFE